MAYETDPDVAAFLTGGKSAPVGKTPTKEPTMEQLREIQKKKKLSDANPQIQPVAETDYTTDPDIAAFTTTVPSKGASQTKIPSQLNQAVGGVLQKAFEAKQKFTPNVVAAVDMLAGVPNFIGYGVGRAFGLTPEEAQKAAGKVPEAIAQPLGRLTGLSETEAYKKSAPVAVQNYISEHLNESAESISSKFNIPVQDAQAMLEAGLATAGLGAGKAYRAGKTAIKNIGEALPKVTVERVGQPTVPPVAEVPQPYQSGGSAAVAHENAVKSVLSEARPDLQTAFANRAPQDITPQELKAIEVHNKFAKVDPEFVPTEGQALQDVAKLSDEYNLKAKEGYEDLRKKFEERDPMLIKGFNNIKDEFAPQHSGVKQQGKANNVLEEIKTNFVDVDSANIKNAYNDLNDLNGNFAVDMQQAAINALKKIEAMKRTNRIPKEIKETLDAYAKGEYEGSGIDFENLRTDTASDVRKAQKASDGTQVRILNIIRDSFEELPMRGENAIQFKEKADLARSLFKNQKDLLNPDSPKYNKAYAMAFEDNRTPVERLTVPHPASEKFFESFVTGNKASPADLSRMLELVGKDSPAHHELIAGITDHLKQKAGVIDDKGNVSQANLRKELNKLGPRLDLIAGSEVAERLRNIGDVAELSEHVRNRGGGSANVSQSTITTEAQATQEIVKGLAETGLNVATGGKSGAVAAVLSPIFKARKERLAQEAANAERQAKVQKMVSPVAGTKLSDIPRIELRGMNKPD